MMLSDDTLSQPSPAGMYLYGTLHGSPVYLCNPRTHKWQDREIIGDKVVVKVCEQCGMEGQRLFGRMRYYLSGARVW